MPTGQPSSHLPELGEAGVFQERSLEILPLALHRLFDFLLEIPLRANVARLFFFASLGSPRQRLR